MYVLCDRCRILRFDSQEVQTVTRNGRNFAQDATYVLHSTRESLQASLAAGCHLCALVRAQLDNYEFSGSHDKYIALKLSVSTSAGSFSAYMPDSRKTPIIVNLSIFGSLGFGFLSNSYLVQEALPPICTSALRKTHKYTEN